MAKPDMSDQFLNALVGKQIILRATDITNIPCTLIAFDKFTMLVEIGSKQVLFYKHAISSISSL